MKNKTLKFSVKDHAVSGETFQLHWNDTWDWLETIPRPSEDDMHRYYESEDYISHSDTKRNLFEKAYHRVREINLRRKLKLINKYQPRSKRLLDFGCGTGDFLRTAQNNGWTITGIEPNSMARDIGNSKTNKNIFTPEKLDSFAKASFDVITLWHVLEHLHDPLEKLKRFHNLLDDGGTLILAVPNHNSFDATYYGTNWAGYDVPRHLWHFSKNAIKKMANASEFQLREILPMQFDAYYVSLLSEKYKSGWLNVFSAFFIASRSNLKASRTGEYSSLIYVLQKA
ncbi:MAG: class I SAM-dependent methyltransferase [Flavobacteriaceae bacterium]|nr:class I SAM-dependent methyltransferase [Bacteroidia bacterium]NNK88607.1 class I SAM-dependent methyltransferase [Flavobacteriaceae bacterium]